MLKIFYVQNTPNLQYLHICLLFQQPLWSNYSEDINTPIGNHWTSRIVNSTFYSVLLMYMTMFSSSSDSQESHFCIAHCCSYGMHCLQVKRRHLDYKEINNGKEEHTIVQFSCHIWPWSEKGVGHKRPKVQNLGKYALFWQFFAQGNISVKCKPYKVKYDMEIYHTMGSTLHAKFGPDRRWGGYRSPTN